MIILIIGYDVFGFYADECMMTLGGYLNQHFILCELR